MKTKPVISFLSLAFCAALVSCGGGTSDAPDEPGPTPAPSPERLEIKITPSIAAVSKATDYGFETGDQVGLYVVNYTGTVPGTLTQSGNHVNNMKFTYSGAWKPESPVYWLDNETYADFYLYYPYSTSPSVAAHKFDVKADQSTEGAYKASDMLWGKAVKIAPTSAATTILANHVMSRIMINLEAGNGFTKESLSRASVSVKINGVKCGSTVDLASGTVTPAGSSESVTPFFTGNEYKALIVPQAVDECDLITVAVDGREYNLRKSFNFKSATSHQFTVTLNKTSNGVNVDIKSWEDDGVDNGGVAE